MQLASFSAGMTTEMVTGFPFFRTPITIPVEDSNPGASLAMSEEVWFEDGLSFQCTRCGNCCTGAPGFVWVNDEELAAIAEFRGETVEQVSGLYTYLARRGRTLRDQAGGDCVFYDRERGCVIYPVRPRQCRTWPFWQSNVASPEAWQRTCEVCPGSGKGNLISVEEILERVKVIRL
jgi:uncharacterized protein